jgi:hypothetical protein
VTQPSPEEIAAGHAFYTKRSLAVYDLAILGYFSRVAWRCPARRVLDHYNAHVSGNHLDVGVGTGYFLDRCTYPSTQPRLALMDLNTACLEVAADRVARYRPKIYEANVLEPMTIDTEKFDSIGMNYLLHCAPGTIRTKAVVFEHLKALANPGATVFGATLLHDGVRRNWMARQAGDGPKQPARDLLQHRRRPRRIEVGTGPAPDRHQGQRRRLCRALLGASSASDERR